MSPSESPEEGAAGPAPEGGPTPGTPGAASQGDGPSDETGRADEPTTFDRRMLEVLVCPLTQDRLEWDAERSELVSRKAGLAYPVRDGIPIMLESEARTLDP